MDIMSIAQAMATLALVSVGVAGFIAYIFSPFLDTLTERDEDGTETD